MLWGDANLQLFFFFFFHSPVLLIIITLLDSPPKNNRGNYRQHSRKTFPSPPRLCFIGMLGVCCAVRCCAVRACVSQESFKPVQVCPGERQCTAPDGQAAAEIAGEIETLSDRQPCIRREHTCHRKVDKHTLVDAAQKRPSAYKKKSKIKNKVTHLSVMRVLLLSTCPRPMKWNQGGG